MTLRCESSDCDWNYKIKEEMKAVKRLNKRLKNHHHQLRWKLCELMCNWWQQKKGTDWETERVQTEEEVLKVQESNIWNQLSLSSQAFYSLSFLEKLDISWNQLTTLTVDFSSGLSALKELRLEHNNLHYISGYRYLSLCLSSECNRSPVVFHIP